ncbi:hypothetical protein GH714_028391 [Hevea brasiliensis]|uniref:HMA domain-containing protein n=1 Tax=Hevea brasiliensis TaxID=3981 RepID=A0A6A6MJI3_HEVBR|nr:hypothetical protein GH714_028391 [Hevea brasiliensis]
MGAEQKAAAVEATGAGGDKKDDAKVVSVYKMDMHCEGCAKKIKRAVKHLEGVEEVKTDCEGNKLTVTGNVDPAKVKARLEEKTKEESGDRSTVVLKIRTHCDGCISKIKKIILKFKGVDSVTVDGPKDLVTVKGTMEVKEMVPYLKENLRRNVDVVPPKKEEENKGGGEKKEEAKAEKKEETKAEKKGDGGKEEAAASGSGAKVEVSKMEYYPAPAPTHWFDGMFGHSYTVEPQHGYYPVNQGYPMMTHGYVQQGYVQPGYVMEPVYHHPMHAPQMFSDENPNSCSVM